MSRRRGLSSIQREARPSQKLVECAVEGGLAVYEDDYLTPLGMHRDIAFVPGFHRGLEELEDVLCDLILNGVAWMAAEAHAARVNPS